MPLRNDQVEHLTHKQKLCRSIYKATIDARAHLALTYVQQKANISTSGGKRILVVLHIQAITTGNENFCLFF